MSVRIKLVNGTWYAFASGPKQQRNLQLVPAINFCNRLNSAQIAKEQA